MSWKPITESELLQKITKSENSLDKRQLSFWQLIKVNPVKWAEREFGLEGGGFWVVAICGSRVVWYNDIEEGFNISSYTIYGQISNYYANQYELDEVVMQLFNSISD